MKPAAATIVKAIVVWAEIARDVPVTVTVAAPVAAVAAAVNLSDVPLKAAVTPEGKPLTTNAGVPVKPFSAVTAITLVPDAPCVTLKLAGEADKVKFGPALTVRLSVAVANVVPDVPVTVTVLVPGTAA